MHLMVHLFDLVALLCPTPVSQVRPTNKQTVQQSQLLQFAF